MILGHIKPRFKAGLEIFVDHLFKLCFKKGVRSAGPEESPRTPSSPAGKSASQSSRPHTTPTGHGYSMTQDQTNEMIRAAIKRVRSSWVECQIAQLNADASLIEAQLLHLERRIRSERALRKSVARLWGRPC